jgi:regulator of nucleoside diphosphate kinase
MNTTKRIYITEADLDRLQGLIDRMRGTRSRDVDHLDDLQAELDKAEVLPGSEIPPDVITMNSTALLRELNSGEEREYTVVYPHQARAEEGKISVLAAMGTALVGYRVGDEWSAPGSKKRFRVEKVLYQPEAQKKIA